MKSRTLVLTALFAALIAALTIFPKIPVPGLTGYVHAGDALIVLAAAVLGFPAVAAAAVGSALADIISGYAFYAPATFLIKGGMAALMCAVLAKKSSWPRLILAALIGEAVMIAGYFAYEAALFGFAAAAAGLPWNALQAGISVVFAPALCAALLPALEKVKRGE